MRIKFIHVYDRIISLENLLEAWREFVKGKRSRKDVQEFEQKGTHKAINRFKSFAYQVSKNNSLSTSWE